MASEFQNGHPFGAPLLLLLFFTPMSVPIEKKHHMQILGRIGPTVSIKSGDLDFCLRQPQKLDLTSSGPPFWGPPQLLFYATFWLEAILTLFGLYGHKIGTHFAQPYKKSTPPPPHYSPLKKSTTPNFRKDQSNCLARNPVTERDRQTYTIT